MGKVAIGVTGLLGVVIGLVVSGATSAMRSDASPPAVVGAPQVVRCTNVTDVVPFDSTPDDQWTYVAGSARTFHSNHGKYFFAPEASECQVIPKSGAGSR